MFTLKLTRKPWRGEEVKARLRMQGLEAAGKCAEFMAERARVYCPVKSGDLKESIKVIPTLGGTKFNVIAEMPYAQFVEFGSFHDTYFIAPNPFMRRALADARREFPALLAAAKVTRPGEAGGSLGTTFTA